MMVKIANKTAICAADHIEGRIQARKSKAEARPPCLCNASESCLKHDSKSSLKFKKNVPDMHVLL